MSNTHVFLPKRTPGIVLHAFFLLILLAGTGILLWLAFQQVGGGFLILYLMGALLLLALLPFVGYRGYALLHAKYTLERDGLHVRWGLRSLDVPLTEVEWVRPATDLQVPITPPRFSTLGAILGEGHHPELGRVEFIGSDLRNSVVVTSMNQVLVLSPEEDEEFVQRFNRMLEMGSLAPIQPHSVVPAAFLKLVFSDRWARFLIPAGFVLSFALLVIVSLAIPNRQVISLGYDSLAIPLESVSSSRMLILPVLGILFYMASLVGGIYCFRRENTRAVSFLLWASGALTQTLLILAASLVLLRPN
jgi:hypothetical protein